MFKPGDLVECVDPKHGCELEKGGHYFVKKADDYFCIVVGIRGRFFTGRFKLHKKALTKGVYSTKAGHQVQLVIKDRELWSGVLQFCDSTGKPVAYTTGYWDEAGQSYDGQENFNLVAV